MMKMSLGPVLFSMMPFALAVPMPQGLQTTLNNLTTAGQAVGGGLASVFLVISGVKFMHGSRDSVESSKLRLVSVIVGVVLCAGCTIMKAWLSSLMGF